MKLLLACLLSTMACRMDELLVAYERATPSIDQDLVSRILGTISLMKRIQSILG